MLPTLAEASFPRAARVLESDDFARALKTRAQRGRYLWVYRRSVDTDAGQTPAAPSAATARPQLGLMIGKRNARTSVLRNAVKRRIREQFRLRQNALPTSQYVVRLSLSITTKDVAAVIAEWTATLDRYIAKTAAAAAVGASAPAQRQPPHAASSLTV
ncbi:MAG: ribonuclease P protein component [Rhizobacter sp.]|nr:ribonuclease P protein component [Burkholderiales bacterium]